MRCLVLCLWMVASAAQAQVLSSPGRLWLTGGAAYREHQQFLPDGSLSVRVGGTGRAIAPTNLHLSGAYFFNDFLGANLEARSELFFATQAGRAIAQPGAELTLAVAGRWLAAPWFSLEGQLGWGLQLRSVIAPGPVAQDVAFTSPSLGVAVNLSPSKLFVSQLFFRAQPANFSLTGIAGFQGWSVAGGAQVSLGALRLGDVQLGGAVTFEVVSSRLSANLGVAQQTAARLGFGVSMMRAPVEPILAPGQRLETLSGKVVSGENALAGVVVTLDGQRPTRTDETGAFSFADVVAGPHALAARKDGFKPGALEVKVPGDSVTVTLVAATGPGRIRGVVRSGEKPLAGASIVTGTQKTSSDAEGRYVLEKVGPGPVKVGVRAAGMTDEEEVAQVPAEAEAALDFALVPKEVEVRATLRGLIRAKDGAAVKATVRVVELKLKLAVKADGRFSADVPKGKYTLIIEARGFVTQTKTVEVSSGDQAIFHSELERTR
ncbi:MAG: carboxypeptidase regulatory-like domain-containing protein [Archangium sp.]|nr:carboxypeptidase regulatory-like domain-containing protein [Archangium sp.]